ncbi:MAG: PAS domain-containing sensor histidine kinase [Rhizobiaceae bacterium]|nr:PAS domain-containing sensor histidine kinase [Rhizobiaceae bacterium]
MADASHKLQVGVSKDPGETAVTQVDGQLVDEPETYRQSIVRGDNDSVTRIVGFITVIAALITGAISFMILIGLTPITPNSEVVITVVVVNGIMVSILLFLILREAYRLIQSRRRGRVAARLHIRIIGLFSLVAAVPAILVAGLATITLDVGLDRWFEIRTKTIVESSVGVARAYMNESYRGLQGATVSMARDLDESRQLYYLDTSGFRQLLTLQTRGRSMVGAFILRADGSVIMESDIKQERALPPPPREALEAAADGEPALIPPGERIALVGAIIKMSEIADAYLYTLRIVNPEVLRALRLMEANTAEYKGLENNRITNQIAFAILYIGVCLIVLLSAIWMGISVADRFVSPIRRLITAADEVSGGNFNVAVSTRHAEGDLRNLSKTFNVMISELKSQRDEILSAKDEMDDRARFTEAVLSGVSASVLGVSQDGEITIANPPAFRLLKVPEDGQIAGHKLHELAPEIASVLNNAIALGTKMHHEQISLLIDGVECTLNIQVTSEQEGDQDHSWVITVDDITDLVSAQRNNAWADIARRIAHEIKNPLTPIQLSAERLRRRFGRQIEKDKEVFDQCTDTIVRQVSDIGRMVDEFSSFARMPKPLMNMQNINDPVREAVFMQKVSHPDIEFVTNFGKGSLQGKFDARLVSQAMTNVIKNAAEAIEAVPLEKRGKGTIEVRTYREDEFLVVDVIDNGKGLPKADRLKLLEPYMTTRQKGTGLGLAIVRKVLEDHGGSIQMLDTPLTSQEGRGAMMRLRLPAVLQEDEINGNTGASTNEQEKVN